MNRVGFGYDLHPLVEGRQLVLGGMVIPFPKGLKGHSDADVVCHAIADALLGAAALGDIGEYFPDTDEEYKDASSIELLKKVGDLVKSSGFSINNIDTTIIAENPKISPYKIEMNENICLALGVEDNQVSIKATTHEGLGELGREEAIAAYAVVILEK